MKCKCGQPYEPRTGYNMCEVCVGKEVEEYHDKNVQQSYGE